MTSILTAVGTAMREVGADKDPRHAGERATDWVKPLVTLAGGIINGARHRRRNRRGEPISRLAPRFVMARA